MTEKEWLEFAEANKADLLVLIETWHPRSPDRARAHDMKITARNTQRFVNAVIAEIAQTPAPASPKEELELAINRGDIRKINNLLNEAWFGVPESTDCWKLTGFRQAVNLMEELPDEE